MPTEEVTVVPTLEATAVLTQEPTKATLNYELTCDSTNSAVSVTFESVNEVVKDEENFDVPIIDLSYNCPVVTIANNKKASKKINDFFVKLNEENKTMMEEYKTDAKKLYKESTES